MEHTDLSNRISDNSGLFLDRYNNFLSQTTETQTIKHTPLSRYLLHNQHPVCIKYTPCIMAILYPPKIANTDFVYIYIFLTTKMYIYFMYHIKCGKSE